MPSGITTDLDGNPRIVGGIVDLGAYEYQTINPIFVDASATGSNNGTTWANAFTDLQPVLQLVSGSATIEVAQGTYYPTTTTDRATTFQLKDGVTIQGGYAGYGQTNPDARDVSTYPTILSGDIGTKGNSSDNSYQVVNGSGTNATAVLDGFSITQGNATGGVDSPFAKVGGGIYINNGSPTINDCTISGNTAVDVGGGIFLGYSSSATLTNCTISGNTAYIGGGLQISNSSPVLINCIISQNSASHGGGGIADGRSASLTLTDCTITGNTAKNGGGLYNQNNGGVYSLTLSNCTISGNTASNDGGAIFNDGTSLSLINCVISGNSASEDGGGIFNRASTIVLINCTLSGNTAATQGGGIDNYLNSSYSNLTNDILWGDSSANGNELYSGAGGGATITYSDVDSTGVAGQGRNIDDAISQNPKFIRPVGTNGSTDYGDLHPQAGSPAINAGSNAALPSSDTTDLGGNPRIFGGIVDMGAYEYQTAQPIYVDQSAKGLNNGTSWANAFTDLQPVLQMASGSATIEVAQGTYHPTAGTDRTATFQLVDGVDIEGGFASGGSSTADPAANPTILSGDIGTQGDNSDNSYHVVTGSGTDPTAILDGFTITGGNADGTSDSNGGGIIASGGSPTISYCIITENAASFAGGGIYNINSTSTLNNCTISGNSAGSSGGGMYNRFSTLTLNDCTITDNSSAGNGGGIMDNPDTSDVLTNCIITGNTATYNGGGVVFLSSSGTLINCLIAGNTATNANGGGIDNNAGSAYTLINCTISGNAAPSGNGGGIYSDGNSTAALSNCILWGDTSSSTAQEIASGTNGASSVTASYSDVDQSGITGMGDMDADPMFVRPVGTNGTNDYGDLHLQSASPTIDAGSNAALPSGDTTDLSGNPRIFGGIVDMGAYEYQIIYVDQSATGLNNGTSWANAFTDLQPALQMVSGSATIEVAQGTYYPTTGNDRSISFTLKNGVTLEGGFAGQANPTAPRNISLYPTILSGDIGTTGNNSDNSYHVVYAGSGVGSTTALDGFTVTGGNGLYNGEKAGTIGFGGGIDDRHGSPIIAHCIISGNESDWGGGIGVIGGSPTINDCLISGNTAYPGGGISAWRGGLLTITNSVISENRSNFGTRYAAAVYLNNGSDLSLTNCSITGNAGAGIFELGQPSFTIVTTLQNCILWDNGDEILSGGEVTGITETITNTDIDLAGYAGTNGNIDADPLFVRNPGTNGAGDYGDLHLQAGSPAINAGSNAAVPAGITTDLDGHSRIVGSAVDMGAYEVQPTNYIYVDASATGNGAGNDWADAYTSLAVALEHSVPNDGQSIDVAAGTYYPTAGTDRSATFQLVDGVAIEGGFAPGGSTAADPAEYPTILSGDIGTTGNNSDNSYHVVTGSGTDTAAVLDGFTVTGGNASGEGSQGVGGGIFNLDGGPTVNDCTITNNSANSGGGVGSEESSSPVLTNCVISGNTANGSLSARSAGFGGGGIYGSGASLTTLSHCTITGNSASLGGGTSDYQASITMTDCTIAGNTATTLGGGIFDDQGNVTITDCTISGNSANTGGGIYANVASTLTNCILWGDTAATDAEIYSSTGSPITVTYSDVQGGFTGTGNINQDPLFVRNPGTNGATDFGDLHLQAGSPAINAGSNAAIPAGITTDLDGNPRIVGSAVDMGAYEYRSTIFVAASATGNGAGNDWADAYTSLAVALQHSVPNDGQSIDVAAGTYYPTAGTDRTATFQLVDGVNIEGGFAPGGSSTANPAEYPTILSGDIGTVGDHTDNSYHVVTGSGTDSTAVLNDVTVTGGNAYYADHPLYGGGILDNNGSPTITNCIITANNTVTGYGPGIYINGGSPAITNCSITRNTGGDGNGVYIAAGSPSITGCVFSANSGGHGGAIANLGGTLTVTNCVFDGNTASGNGGGIRNGGTLTVTNCVFDGNTTTSSDGGGISNEGTLTVTNCVFDGNTAVSGNGGGIYNSNTLTVTNCVFSGNTSGSNGGGIDTPGITNVINCTFSGNSAKGAGGGIQANSEVAQIITNCILSGDTASTDPEIAINTGGNQLIVSYSDIQGGFTGTGNIDADPQFVRSPSPGADGVWGTADDDYGDLHLQFTSLCIDAGSNAAVPTGVTTDLDGNPRIFDFPGAHDPGAIVDMGAYELGLNLDQVIVPAGQTLALPTGGYDFTANKLTIGTGGTLDVGDDTLGITYSPSNSQASQIAGWIASGYGAGQWNGTGIVSTATLGQPANLTGVGYFDDGAQVKIRRSWYGDTNLDGVINADDYALVLLGQQTHQTNWQSGNFNYDTKVNADDWMTFILGASYSHGQKLFNSSAAIPAARSNSLLDSPTPLV